MAARSSAPELSESSPPIAVLTRRADFLAANRGLRVARPGFVLLANPNGGLGKVEDIAEAVWYLASGNARYVNGHQLVVDGGVCHSLLRALPRS